MEPHKSQATSLYQTSYTGVPNLLSVVHTPHLLATRDDGRESRGVDRLPFFPQPAQQLFRFFDTLRLRFGRVGFESRQEPAESYATTLTKHPLPHPR